MRETLQGKPRRETSNELDKKSPEKKFGKRLVGLGSGASAIRPKKQFFLALPPAVFRPLGNDSRSGYTRLGMSDECLGKCAYHQRFCTDPSVPDSGRKFPPVWSIGVSQPYE